MSTNPDTNDWMWKEEGVAEAALRKKIKRIRCLYKARRPPVCYPGTRLDLDQLEFLPDLFAHHHNLIGTHTHGMQVDGRWESRQAEGGFESIQKMEARAIWMIASTIGGTPETVDGIFCGGGTESNLQGMWVGRAWLRQRPDPMHRGIAILTTPLVHYSVIKNAAILDIGHPQWTDCPRCRRSHLFCPDQSGSGVNLVGMNNEYQMSVEELERVFHLKYAEGFRRFMIVATVATTTMGSVDPIKEIGDFVSRMHRTTSAHIYLHVDASFGGFTVPFVRPEVKIGFSVPEVMSVTMDGDKMGRLPYPAGIFLCRKGLTALVARKVNYVRGQEDDSVPGSRSALASVCAWYLFQKDGRVGQRRYVEACLTARDQLAELLKERLGARVRVLALDPGVNQLPMCWQDNDGLPSELPARVLATKGSLEFEHLRHDLVPSKPSDVLSCPLVVYKLCIMPHLLRPGVLQAFVDRLSAMT